MTLRISLGIILLLLVLLLLQASGGSSSNAPAPRLPNSAQGQADGLSSI